MSNSIVLLKDLEQVNGAGVLTRQVSGGQFPERKVKGIVSVHLPGIPSMKFFLGGTIAIRAGANTAIWNAYPILALRADEHIVGFRAEDEIDAGSQYALTLEYIS